VQILKSLRQNWSFFQSASDPLVFLDGGSWKESHNDGLSRCFLEAVGSTGYR